MDNRHTTRFGSTDLSSEISGFQSPSVSAGANDYQNSSFSSVLQEIFRQTQTEIQARNRNQSSQYGTLVPLDSQFGAPDAPFRYEPMLDPALSYIKDILAEDDDSATNHPCLSLNEFVAYQAKATEVAALLKEDSPSLALKIEPQSPVSPEGAPSSISEGSYPDLSNSFNLSSLETDRAPFMNSIPEYLRNEILLDGLRGPVSRPPPTVLQAYEVTSPESMGIGQVNRPAKTCSQDDIGLRSHGHKSQKSQKSASSLKPRKETAGMRRKGSGKSKSSKDGDQEFVDINDLLLQSAQAIGVNHTKRAVEILNKVRQHASPYGNAAQRLAYYFAEALDARFSNTGWPLYLGLLRRRPSAAEILKATYMYMASCPFVKAYHYFINRTILNVAKGASKVHILELQVTGFQYPSLLKAFADRPEGPPQVHLIGLGFPHYSMLPARTDIVLEGVQKTGRQLSEYAQSLGVPFQYTAWAGNREDLCMQDFVSPYRNADEVLVVISAYMLRYVMDDTLDSPTVRSKLLKQGRDINPDVYIQGIVTGSYSTPFFTRRFREALFHFESVFDMLDTFIQKEDQDRIVFESEILGKAILNVVACEGNEVVERIDKYKHWQAVTEEVGFQQLPLNEEIKEKVQFMLETWHKEYTCAEDSQYLLMGWKGRMLHAMSTWKATPEIYAYQDS